MDDRKPTFEGLTVGKWRQRLRASEARLPNSKNRARIFTTIARYAEIIERLESEEREQQARAMEDFKSKARCPIKRNPDKRVERRARDLKDAVRATKRQK